MQDAEEQVLDDSELPSNDPPTTSSILTTVPPPTTQTPSSKPDPHALVTNPPLTESAQSPRTAKAPPTVQPDPTSISASTPEPLPQQRRVQQGQNSDRSNPVAVSRSVPMKPYSDVYNNRYPPPQKPYKGNEPYYDPSNVGTVPYRVNVPYGNRLPNPRMPYSAPRSGSQYIQPSNQKSYNAVPSFNPRQYRPRLQGIPNRPQVNPANSSYSDIRHQYPNSGYYNPARTPRTVPPRQAINRFESPYYGPQPGVDWQYQVRQTQMPIKTEPPPMYTADFADNEVINFAAEPKRILPASDRPRGVTASEVHRNLPTSEHQRGMLDVHRSIPVSEMPRSVSDFRRGVSDFHREVPEFHRDITTADTRRGISTHDHTLPNFAPNIPGRNIYTDFPDDITTVSDSDVSPVMSTRSGSQSSLAVYCNTPHRDETASVMSFTSGASTHQDLDSKIDQVRNLLAVIDTRDAKETAQTLYSLSTSKENCQAMRLSGCLPLLIQLQHKSKLRDPRVAHQVRMRSAQAIRNIVAAGMEDKRGKREYRVLQLIEVVRSYCTELRYVRKGPSSSKLTALNNALAAIMKLSFEEEHRVAIGNLGGVEAIGEFLELSYVDKDGNLSVGKVSIFPRIIYVSRHCLNIKVRVCLFLSWCYILQMKMFSIDSFFPHQLIFIF